MQKKIWNSTHGCEPGYELSECMQSCSYKAMKHYSIFHEYILSGECMLPGSVLSQQRFGATDIKEWRSAPARGREKEPFGSYFYMFFPPLGLPYANWASWECCLFYLKSSLWSSDLPLTFLCSIFLGFSLPVFLNSFFLF